MSCNEACGIAALIAVTNLTLFSDFAVHFIAHSKPEQKTTLPLEKQIAKINLEVLKVSVSSCTQNLAQEAEKSKNSFSGWLFFLCGQNSSDNSSAVMRTILNSGGFLSW